MTTRLLITALLTIAPLWAQLEYYHVAGNEERPISGLLSLGETATGEPLDALIRVKNAGRNMEILTTLSVVSAGPGFTLTKGLWCKHRRGQR